MTKYDEKIDQAVIGFLLESFNRKPVNLLLCCLFAIIPGRVEIVKESLLRSLRRLEKNGIIRLEWEDANRLGKHVEDYRVQQLTLVVAFLNDPRNIVRLRNEKP